MKTRVLNRFIPSALFQRYPEKKLMTLLGATNLIRDELGEEPEALRLMRFEELWQVLLFSSSRFAQLVDFEEL